MSKRIALWAAIAIAGLVALLVPASPASACVTGCQAGGIVVSPHSGSAGSFSHTLASKTINWTVKNTGTAVATVAMSPGATGCVVLTGVYVSPTSATLDPGDTVVVHTYIKDAAGPCLGAGTAWLSAGMDQGSQTVTVT